MGPSHHTYLGPSNARFLRTITSGSLCRSIRFVIFVDRHAVLCVKSKVGEEVGVMEADEEKDGG